MTDVLIRNVPDDALARIDDRAARLGLSRNEYLRRRIVQDLAPPGATHDVQIFAKFEDLLDDELMGGAWS